MKIALDSLARFNFRSALWRDRTGALQKRKTDVASVWGVDLGGSSQSRAAASVCADDLVLFLAPETAKRNDVAVLAKRLLTERATAMEDVWWTQPSEQLAWVQMQTGAASLVEGGTLHLPNVAAAVVASYALALNVANADEQWAEQHELLSAAAWLGVLLRGRPALMRPEIARTLAAHRATGTDLTWTGGQVLALLAELQGMHNVLTTTADTVLADDTARCVFPANAVTLPAPSVMAGLRNAL